MKYYEDPILGKGRAADISGGTGGSGTTYIGGFAIGISGETISRLRYMPIESVTGNSVTLQAGHAYKAYATSTAITLNTETVPEGQFGMEGHIEIYVAGTGYVITGTNVVLANALEPDSVNNCTLRFHDGVCIISVEDHVAGYIVVNGATSGEGSLYYGIATSTNDYVAFDASLNGQVIPLAGAVAEGEKHLVGNGYTETTLTGAVDCGENKFTVANLALSNVQVTGGVMTLGDAYIPSGSTVAVSGGGLAVEKVSGDGVINLNKTNIVLPTNAVAIVSNVTITGGSAAAGGVFDTSAGSILTLSGCIISGNSAADYGVIRGNGALNIIDTQITGNTVAAWPGAFQSYKNVNITSSIISGNQSVNGSDILATGGGTMTIEGSTVGNVKVGQNENAVLRGTNKIETVTPQGGSNPGSVTLTSGAILDLTGNANATPIAPGGGITFEQGGATVLYSSGAVSGSYMMDNVTLPAGAKLTNVATVNLNGGQVVVSGGATVNISGCLFTSGSNSQIDSGGGAFYVAGANTTVNLTGATITGNIAIGAAGQGVLVQAYNAAGQSVNISNCIISGNGDGIDNTADIRIANGGSQSVHLLGGNTIGFIAMTNGGLTIAGENSITRIQNLSGQNNNVAISSGAVITLTDKITTNAGMIEVVGGTCTVNGVTVEPGTYTSIVSSGGSAVINQ